jgi:hypothetical protein
VNTNSERGDRNGSRCTYHAIVRIPIRYSSARGWIVRAVGLLPRWSYVDIGADSVRVRMGWAFRTRIARTNIAEVTRSDRYVLSTGVHGWNGRWLVNAAGPPLVVIRMSDGQRAFVLGYPVRLRELLVSVVDPESVIAALA